MLIHIVIAVLIGVVVGLVCIGAGRLLKSVNVPPVQAFGGFLEEYGWVIGVVAALWALVTGWRPF